jgi:hypothetical protein
VSSAYPNDRRWPRTKAQRSAQRRATLKQKPPEGGSSVLIMIFDRAAVGAGVGSDDRYEADAREVETQDRAFSEVGTGSVRAFDSPA